MRSRRRRRSGAYAAWPGGRHLPCGSVRRIGRAHGLKPPLVKTFKVSRDKNLAAKVEDVVGLYLNPPGKALVLCVDEKGRIRGPRPDPTGIADAPAR